VTCVLDQADHDVRAGECREARQMPRQGSDDSEEPRPAGRQACAASGPGLDRACPLAAHADPNSVVQPASSVPAIGLYMTFLSPADPAIVNVSPLFENSC
jgi:hypothetical protein